MSSIPERRVEAEDPRGRDYADRLRKANETLQGDPTDVHALIARARTLASWGRYFEACASYALAGAGGAFDLGHRLEMARALLSAGRLEEARRALHGALALAPTTWTLHFELGRVHQAAGEFAEAIREYARALSLDADNFHCLNNSGTCHISLKNPATAEPFFRRSTEIEPGNPLGWRNLSVSLSLQCRNDEALRAIQHAESLMLAQGHEPGPELFFLLATYLNELGRAAEAKALLERYLPMVPDLDGHYLYGHILLREGKFAEGWAHNEFRWILPPLVSLRPRFACPEWRGQALQGKTILLRPEQGLGDAWQFIRYAPLVKAMGAQVVLQSWPGLDAVDHRRLGLDVVVGRGQSLPPFDYWIHLVSLPGVFGTESDSIPAGVPYIDADPVLIERWKTRLEHDGKLNVGLVWAGNPDHPRDRQRSIPLQMLAPLLQVPGIRHYSLQVGARAAEAEGLPPEQAPVPLAEGFAHFGDTAAAISALDLVISVDTAVAHLAGALGKPVWLLLPEPADWRWLTGRDDSPWYPTARLFRQSRSGDWAELIERVTEALRDRASGAEDRRTAIPLASPPSSLATTARGERVSRTHLSLSSVVHGRAGILQYFPCEAPQGPSLEWYGEYLEPQLHWVKCCVRPGGRGLEVGAGVGAHSIALARALGDEGHLFLQESRMHLRHALVNNLAANLVRNVTLIGGSTRSTGDAAMDSLDDLQLDRVDWIKANHETEASRLVGGGQETLWRLRPILLLAVSSETTLLDLASLVADYGYRCWKTATPYFNPDNFNRQPDDIFGGRIAYTLAASPEELAPPAAFSQLQEL